MKNFSIQKYFFNAPSFESQGSEKKISTKSKITVGDGRLDKWELQIIEKAVEAKCAWVLQKFLQQNNVLLEEIVSELRNRIDRSSDGSGTKYVQSLLKVLQDNSAKTAEKPKMQVKYIPRSYADLGYAPNDPRVQSGEKLIIPVQVPVLNHSEAKPVYNETQVKFTQEDYQKHCANGKGGMFCEVMKYELNKQAKEQENKK